MKQAACSKAAVRRHQTTWRPDEYWTTLRLRHIAFTNTIFVYFRVLFVVLYVWPAFCHVIIKRILMMMMVWRMWWRQTSGDGDWPRAPTCMCLRDTTVRSRVATWTSRIYLLTYLPTYSLSSRITFKLACLTYKFFTTGQLAYLRMLLYTTTPLHALYGRLINFSSTCRDFPLNLVTDRLVTWLLQSGMDYLLTSDFHLLSTPLNAVWKGGAETASTGKCKCGK